MKRLVMVLLLAGCATTGSVDTESSGISRVFPVGFEQTEAATVATIESLGLNYKGKEAIPGGGAELTFTKSVSAWSWGEVGKVAVRPVNDASTRVIVAASKRSRLQITGTKERDFARSIFMGIEQRLGVVSTE